MRAKYVIVMAAVLAIVVAPCFAEQMIQNGSFENGKDIPASGYVACTPGAGGPTSDINYWTLINGDTSSSIWGWYMSSDFAPPNEGDRMANLVFENERYLSQDFSVVAGGKYDVSFYNKLRGGSQPLEVSVGTSAGMLAGTSGTLTVTGSGTDTLTGTTGMPGSYTNQTFSFVPSATGTATLKFFYVTGTGVDSHYIDSVSVTVVPEPSTLVLLATGLVGLLAYAWRKRK